MHIASDMEKYQTKKLFTVIKDLKQKVNLSINLNAYKNIISYFYLFLLINYVLFGRSFSGIYIFNYRLGEIIIGYFVIYTFYLLIKYFVSLNEFREFKKQIIVFGILVLIFFINLSITNGSIFSEYTFKSSSYIWSISSLFFSYFLFKDLLKSKLIKYFFSVLLPVNYILIAIYTPEFIINFFLSNSDKWDFLKASDLLLIYVLSNSSNYLFFEKKINSITYFFFSSSIFFPLFLFMSKGAFYSAIIYFFVFLLIYFKVIKKDKFKFLVILFISILLFFLSTFEIWGNFNFQKDADEINKNDLSFLSLETLKLGVKDLATQKNTTEIFASLYISNNRVYSTDLMFDWRLQIWQDVFIDLNKENKILFGYGYNDIIPAMDDVNRKGSDGTNENVHNYFVNILARGGVLHLFSITCFVLCMFIDIKNFELRKIFLFTILPIYIVSFFDSSMESVRFPLIFYTGVTIIFKLNLVKIK